MKLKIIYIQTLGQILYDKERERERKRHRKRKRKRQTRTFSI